MAATTSIDPAVQGEGLPARDGYGHVLLRGDRQCDGSADGTDDGLVHAHFVPAGKYDLSLDQTQFGIGLIHRGDCDDYIRIVSVRCVVPVDGIAIVTSVHECRGILGIGESQCCPVGGGVADEYLVVHAGIEEQTLLVVHDGIVLEGEVLSG